ncbi:MAG: hypothetical protein IOC82_16465 [Aestuariivirga sp.]|uniref:hypothetical protein n=1 Tax=Aestuariivirga sp. TaxID=2650926 RepID=UPI0025C41C68|nr:hypothetical protein [Aestuariivirga sp.]MCA3562609.1 hypothetical protein [Aestuariivirga sp.]
MTVSMGVPRLSDRIAGGLYLLHMGKATGSGQGLQPPKQGQKVTKAETEAPAIARLQALWSSPEHAPRKTLRQNSSACRIETAEGYSP